MAGALRKCSDAADIIINLVDNVSHSPILCIELGNTYCRFQCLTRYVVYSFERNLLFVFYNNKKKKE